MDTYGMDDNVHLHEHVVVTVDGIDAKLAQISAALTAHSTVAIEFVDKQLTRHTIQFVPQSMQRSTDGELFINGFAPNDDIVVYLRTETNALIVHMNR